MNRWTGPQSSGPPGNYRISAGIIHPCGLVALYDLNVYCDLISDFITVALLQLYRWIFGAGASELLAYNQINHACEGLLHFRQLYPLSEIVF